MLQSLKIMSNFWRLVVFSLFIVPVSCQGNSCRVDVQDPDDPNMLNIVCVGESTFPEIDNLAGLEKVKISAIRVINGSLKVVPEEAVNDFPMLKTIDFSRNQIAGFTKESVQYAPMLTTINLSYNSLRCDETLIPWLVKWRLIDQENRSVNGDCTNTASNIQQLVEAESAGATKNNVQFTKESVTIYDQGETLYFTRSGNLDLATDFRVKAPNFTVTMKTISVPSNENTGPVNIKVNSDSVVGINHTVELIPQYVIYPVASVVINRPDVTKPVMDKCVEKLEEGVIINNYTLTKIDAGYQIVLLGVDTKDKTKTEQSFKVTDDSGTVMYSWKIMYRDGSDPTVSNSTDDFKSKLIGASNVTFTFKDPSGNKAVCTLSSGVATSGNSLLIVILIISFKMILP